MGGVPQNLISWFSATADKSLVTTVVQSCMLKFFFQQSQARMKKLLAALNEFNTPGLAVDCLLTFG